MRDARREAGDATAACGLAPLGALTSPRAGSRNPGAAVFLAKRTTAMERRPPAPHVDEPILAVVARELLTRELDARPDDVGAAIVVTAEKLERHVARLMGLHGTQALFRRSVVSARRVFTWLPSLPAGLAPDAVWSEVRAAVRAQPRDVAFDGALVLVTSFLELLGKLVGAALTMRLVREIWPAPPANPTEETP